MWDAMEQHRKDVDEYICQLKADAARAHEDYRTQNDEICKLQGEIERLKARLKPRIDTVEGTPTGYGEDEIDRLREEIKRLRSIIRCETIQPPADVADDQTTELAVQLASAEATATAYFQDANKLRKDLLWLSVLFSDEMIRCTDGQYHSVKGMVERLMDETPSDKSEPRG